MNRLAERLINHACAVMPESRREWAAAMRAEFDAMPNDAEALAWAAGCVWASYRERIEPMDVFVKSLLRATAVWLVLLAFFGVLFLLAPPPKRPSAVVEGVRLLMEFYGGIFATLWIAELLIARFWTASGRIFKKTLGRTIALWLWPMGFEVYTLIRGLMDPVIRGYIEANTWPFVRQTLIDFTGHGGGTFAGIFVPLLLCELAIARFWRARYPA